MKISIQNMLRYAARLINLRTSYICTINIFKTSVGHKFIRLQVWERYHFIGGTKKNIKYRLYIDFTYL